MFLDPDGGILNKANSQPPVWIQENRESISIQAFLREKEKNQFPKQWIESFKESVFGKISENFKFYVNIMGYKEKFTI